MLKNIKLFSEGIYKNFLLRDLSNICSGGLLLFLFRYGYFNDLSSFIEKLNNNIVLLLIFLASSYLIGLTLTFVTPKIKILPKDILDLKVYVDAISIQIDIEKEESQRTIQHIEQLIFCRTLFSSIALDFILGIPLIVYHYYNFPNSVDCILIFIFVPISALMIFIARLNHDIYEKLLRALGIKTITK